MGKKMRLTAFAVCGLIGFAGWASAAVTVPIGSWSLDSQYNANATLNDSTGSAPVVTYTEGSSDGIVAGFNSTTLNPGDQLTFSGTITFPSALTGGVQFRIGLMNTNGNDPATTDAGWLGYLLEVPNANNMANLGARGTSGNWPSGTGLVSLANQTGQAPTVNAPGAPVTEDFALTLIYNGASANAVTGSMVSSDSTYNMNITGTDSTSGAGSTQANNIYNEVGFFFGGSTFGGSSGVASQTSFSNLKVTYTAVPEPGMLGGLLLGLGAMTLRRRKSK